MKELLALVTSSALLAAPVFAAPAADPTKARQISEVVFKNYPERALAKGEQGAVYFLVTLDKAAQPTSCQVTHGSGHPLLDQETCDLIVQHATFKSLRDANGRATKSTHEGVVNWRIPGTPPVPVTPVALTKQTAPAKQVCKSTVRSGTLAAVERTCMTPREWALQTDEIRASWDELQGRKGMSCDTMRASTPNRIELPAAPTAGC